MRGAPTDGQGPHHEVVRRHRLRALGARALDFDTTDGGLDGARDFRRLPVLHSFFMDNKQVQELTVRFLNEGHFERDEKRQPIEKD